MEKSIEAADGRVLVQDRGIRQLIRSIANPVKLGEMGETHFVLGQHWKAHFVQNNARDGGQMTVTKMRQWIDLPQAMGLPVEVQNLIIMTFAEQTIPPNTLSNSSDTKPSSMRSSQTSVSILSI
jgi:hypothetical protein